LKPIPLNFIPSSSFPASPGLGKMPRSSDKIRPVLKNIAESNQERFALLQRLEQEMKSAIRLEHRRSYQLLQNWLTEQARFAKIFDSDTGKQMSDEEIIDALSEMLGMDLPEEKKE
jgi:hypothetical protein